MSVVNDAAERGAKLSSGLLREMQTSFKKIDKMSRTIEMTYQTSE